MLGNLHNIDGLVFRTLPNGGVEIGAMPPQGVTLPQITAMNAIADRETADAAKEV